MGNSGYTITMVSNKIRDPIVRTGLAPGTADSLHIALYVILMRSPRIALTC